MSKTGSGQIVVTCSPTIRGEVIQQIVNDLGLKFSANCVQGDFYFIQVPRGTEKRWANAFKGQPEVSGAQPVPVYAR